MYLIELLKTIILGIVQGITEWLPVSSTGHMILVDQFMPLNQPTDFINLFLVVIQFGSILAVVTLYFHKLNPFSPKKSNEEKADTWSMWFKVLVACLPAAVIGLKYDDLINQYTYNAWVVAAMLIVYGVFFILLERSNKLPKTNDIGKLSYKTAFLIGVFQVLSLIPGTSRSGSTILGATILGCSRFVATEFSFFLAVPVMLGASALKIVKFFMETGGGFTPEQIGILLTGMVVAYIVSVFAIKFLMEYIRKHDFTVFGYYRIVVGILVILYFLISGAQVVVH